MYVMISTCKPVHILDNPAPSVDVSFQRNNSELEAEVQALFERNDSLVLCRAAQLGDETVIREFLNKFRNEVSLLSSTQCHGMYMSSIGG